MSSLGKALAVFTGASMVGSLTQVAKGKVTAVLLGTQGVGVLNQLTNLWSLFSVVASLGFFNGMVRHLAPAWDDGDRLQFRRHLSSNALLLLTAGMVLALLGCFFSSSISAFAFDDRGARAGLICLILTSIPLYVAGQTYRAALNATRSVNALVRSRIGADVLSVVVLVALVFPFGLRGAVMGYIGLHLVYLGVTAFFTWKVLGRDVVVPSTSLFNSVEIRKNVGYGANGLVAVAVGILTTLIVSRWIIATGGAGANGLFTMALKVATVYLGGLSAAAAGYYFPTLAKAKSDAEMHGHMDATLSLYLFLIPPIILILMVGGEWMMRILFAPDFVPAAALLLLILPGDLFRITAETIGLAVVVRGRLAASTGSYILWAAIYLALVYVLLPRLGIAGVALAYLVSQLFNAAFQIILCWYVVGYRFAGATLAAICRGLAMIAAMAVTIRSELPEVWNWLAGAVFLGLWTVLSWSNPDFRNGARKLVGVVKRTASSGGIVGTTA